MKNIHLHIANASGALTPQLAVINSAFDRAVETCDKLLHVDNVDILCTNEPEDTIPEVGMGGFTANKNLIYFPVDSSKKLDENELYYTICHELHHAKCNETSPHLNNLLGMVVCEGLATCFEEEVSGNKAFLPLYLDKKPYKQLLINKFMPHFSDTDFYRYKWFIEDDDKELPRWAGYTVGYHITKRYLAVKNKKASEAVTEASELILEFVRDTLIGAPPS